jgi:hypothetical protein
MIDYERLPNLVKDNLSAEQWPEAERHIIRDGVLVPETTDYINLKNGQIHTYQSGEPADGPLLAVHDIAGGRGRDRSQFDTSPRGAHEEP